MPTIYDVAKQAGVSISTVSRVLNNNPNVLHDTRQRVLKVIAELNFKPNPIARGLVVKQTNILEVFFSWTGYQLNFGNSWYMGILNGVNEVARQNKYGLLINTVAGDYDPQAVYEKAFYNIVDGVLIVSPYLKEEEVRRMVDERLPFVLISYRIDDPRIDFVDSDNAGAAVMVVDHLVGLGRRRLAVVNGILESSRNAIDRWAGFQEGLKKHGLPLPPEYVTEGRFNVETGEACAEKLLSLPQPPDAIFAINDYMAMGVVNVLKKRGMTPGREVAVVGFDDITEAAMPYYELTTVRQDFIGISSEASRLLIRKIRHQSGNWVPQHIMMPTQLVVRKSCGAKQ
jgi:DNA-binding LacI/PurR family transcriptional regulator